MPRGGGYSLIWPIQVCAAEQGMVFKVLSLKRGVFLDWKPIRVWTVKTCNERSTIAIPIIFFLNIHFHDYCVKNYLILYAKQNKSGQKVVSPVLNRVAKWAMFVLNWVGVRRPRRHTSTQTSLECPPGSRDSSPLGAENSSASCRFLLSKFPASRGLSSWETSASR